MTDSDAMKQIEEVNKYRMALLSSLDGFVEIPVKELCIALVSIAIQSLNNALDKETSRRELHRMVDHVVDQSHLVKDTDIQ
jgi:hypothetical protein